MHDHNHHDYLSSDKKFIQNERKTLWVLIITFLGMILEVSYGYFSKSMALLSDGWHMASHMAALGISYIAYRCARSQKFANYFSFGTGKFVPLGGYTNALILGLVSIFILIESIERLINPLPINFSTAIVVAVLGLLVNFFGVIILWDDHDNDYHDHNHKSAFIHILADALTSLAAILALLLGNYWGWNWADPLCGILASIVILKWSYDLLKGTIWDLLDGHSAKIDKQEVRDLFKEFDDIVISDLHIWKIAPNALACEIIFCTAELKGTAFYRDILIKSLPLDHLIVEERFCDEHRP